MQQNETKKSIRKVFTLLPLLPTLPAAVPKNVLLLRFRSLTADRRPLIANKKIEGCLADGDALPRWLVEGKYRLEYEKRFSAVLHDAQEYTTLTALSRITGIRHAQLSHYANAVSRPQPAQRQRIIDGIHTIGQRLAQV